MSSEVSPITSASFLCIQALERAKEGVEKNKSAESCSNKYIKLAKRFYDASRCFLAANEKAIDVVGSKAMLYLARSCLLNAHVLQHQFNLEERAKSKTFLSKVKEQTGKVVSKTLGRAKDKFMYSEEDYAKQGIGVIINAETNRRKYFDELSNSSIAMKTIANKLFSRVDKSGLIRKNVKVDPDFPEYEKEKILNLLNYAMEDAKISYNTMVIYFEKLQTMTGRDETILSMFETLPKGDQKLRSDALRESKREARFVDVHDTLKDITRVSNMLASLPKLIELTKTKSIPEY